MLTTETQCNTGEYILEADLHWVVQYVFFSLAPQTIHCWTIQCLFKGGAL